MHNAHQKGEGSMRKKGLEKAAAAILTGVLLVGAGSSRVYAEPGYTVTAYQAVMYANDKTVVYATPDLMGLIVTGISENFPVEVTGITSNGWYRIELEGTYYIPGYGLKKQDDKSALKAYQADDIARLTSGTFSFYKNSELRGFTADEIEDMDANTYIKYLDSYLMGNAVVENCILEDSGLTLKEVYEKKAKEDSKVASVTMKNYLVNYRNDYLENSFWGPVRTQEELKVTLNRAIRYDYKEFSTVYKNAAVGSESTKMESILNEVIADIKAEQGVTFGCEPDYGSYKNEDGKTTTGWIIEFVRKDK